MLILSVTIAFLLLGVLWLAAVLHEHGLTPMRRMAELMKRPAAEIALVALVAIGMIHHGATKTNVNCKMENVKLGDAPMIVPDSTETGILHFTFYTLHSNGVPVVAGTITAEDCAAGYVLAAVRTGETHSFLPPPDAVVCADWMTFGAARDWIYENVKWKMENVKWAGDETRLRIQSDGWAEALPAPGTTGVPYVVFFPFKATLGIVPQANWPLILHSTFYTLHSQFWHCFTPSNTLQMTWVNALLDRAATNPVSFQCEVSANGDVEFRYDLKNVKCKMENGEWDAGVISNVLVGVSGGGGVQAFGVLPKSVTSLRFARIDPYDAVLSDRDGDGIPTVDEVFLHHTDPGSSDTDYDGLSDSDEILVWHTDPTDPHAVRPDMPDGMAVKIGDENPWAYPEGSTNTIWEHVFYSGTTNGAFAYPQPDDTAAVLAVTVSGEGSGELVVGGTVVPLLAPPQMRSAPASSTLYARMVKGVTYPVHLRMDGTLDLTVTSDDFAFGVGISSARPGVDLAALNVFAPAFGLPVAPGTNAPAENLNLDLNVKLTHGRVRLSFVNPGCRFLVMAEIGEGIYRHWAVIADSETRPVLDMSITAWRRMFGKPEGEDFSAPVAVMAAGTGTCDVRFTYWTVVDGAFAEDSAVQRVTAVPPPLTIDHNKNGMRDAEDIGKCIDGTVAYFWRNDDCWKDDDAFSSSGSLNASDGVVNGRNDLINFLAFAIDLKAFAANWGTDTVRYCLETDHGTTMSNAKLSLSNLGWDEMDGVVSGTGTDVGGVPLHQAPVARLGDGTNLPPSFVALSQLDSGIVLMEFPDLSRYGRLYLNVYSKANDAKLFSSVINLHVGEAEHMVAWENIRGAAGGTGGVPTRHNTQDWPPDAHQPGNVVFVHGYNMHEGDETKQWAINVFKKLWWSGLDRGFVAVQWRGNEGQVYVPAKGYVTPNYYGNVRNAFASADALKTALEEFSGPKWFLAHSLGNMLVSAAIQDCGMPYEKYFMLNAAVAMEAFDATNGITQASHDNMTPTAWTGYANRVRSTHWFELFPQGDGRRLLTWKGRFTNVTEVVNFYSTQDEVLANGNGSPVLAGRDFAWYGQETRKGVWPFMLHEYEGGWAFNAYYDIQTYTWVGDQQIVDSRHLTPVETESLNDGHLRQNPFFLGFVNPEMCTSTNGSLVATNYLYRAEMLAYSIPSESYAIGANALAGFLNFTWLHRT